jgi:hypothetical protein
VDGDRRLAGRIHAAFAIRGTRAPERQADGFSSGGRPLDRDGAKRQEEQQQHGPDRYSSHDEMMLSGWGVDVPIALRRV